MKLNIRQVNKILRWFWSSAALAVVSLSLLGWWLSQKALAEAMPEPIFTAACIVSEPPMDVIIAEEEHTMVAEPQELPQPEKRQDPLKELFLACAQVESNNNPSAVGDEGRSVGIVQIQKKCVDDVNRWLGWKAFTYQDRKDPVKSELIFRAYLQCYGERYSNSFGKEPTQEILARIWNSGPDRQATDSYWRKVKKALGE